MNDPEAHLQHFLITNVSHEFRTPLASLTASVEILDSDLDYLSRPEIRELLKTVQLSVSSLQMLVDNLLNSANIEAGRFHVSPQPQSLLPILASAIQLMQPLLDRRNQTLSLVAPLDLPWVLADAYRIQQVLLNLLMNASKYSPQDAQIDIILALVGQHVRLAIVDQGMGIPAEAENKIFERFVRLPNHPEEEKTGLGLGLSVVKAIVEGHGGNVGVESRRTGGASFWFTLQKGKVDEDSGGR